MDPIPLGTVVDYHGSHTHGRYVITEHSDPEGIFSDEEKITNVFLDGPTLTEAYPDGVAYTIWKQGVLRKFGNRAYSISRVRRGSLTVIEQSPEEL